MGYEILQLATVRQNAFATVWNLVDTNKPSGWTVVASFPEDEASFPCIVINDAKAKPTIVTLETSGVILEDIKLEIEFYALARSGMDKINEGRDNVQNTFLSNASTLDTYGLYLKENPFDDSEISPFISGKQKINQAGCIVSLGMK